MMSGGIREIIQRDIRGVSEVGKWEGEWEIKIAKEKRSRVILKLDKYEFLYYFLQ